MEQQQQIEQQQMEQQVLNQIRIDQELEQLRIVREMEQETKPSKNGWIVVLVFAIVMICLFFALSANAEPLNFADRNIERRALIKGDTDNDGHISKEEADSVKSLILTQYRTDMFEVSTYEDLAKFPNLEKLWLGESKLETVDLSKNWNLKYVHIESDNLKTLILAVGCVPKLAYPMHSGEVLIKRIKNPDAPGAMFFPY